MASTMFWTKRRIRQQQEAFDETQAHVVGDPRGLGGWHSGFVMVAGCDPFDFDMDWDVDLRDFAELQQLFTGPASP